MGPLIDHTGGWNWGAKRGSFWLLKMSQDRGCHQWYISTPAWRSDPPFHMPIHWDSNEDSHVLGSQGSPGPSAW